MGSWSGQRGGYCSHSWRKQEKVSPGDINCLCRFPPHRLDQLQASNLSMDWGTLVCTKGTAPCSFSTCTTTQSHSEGTPSFKLKPSVESWPLGKEDTDNVTGTLQQPRGTPTTTPLAGQDPRCPGRPPSAGCRHRGSTGGGDLAGRTL